MRALSAALLVVSGAAVASGAGLRATLQALSPEGGGGGDPLKQYYERDKWGFNVFDYDRLGVHRESLQDVGETEAAGEAAGEAAAAAATEASAAGAGSSELDLVKRIEQLGGREDSPQLARLEARRPPLQRWLTFRKVRQTCPTFPFCNHIPPPPPLMPLPVDIMRPMGKVHFPFVANGQSLQPPAPEAQALAPGQAKVPAPVATQNLPKREQYPFQRDRGNSYEFESHMYFPPLGRIEDPKGDNLNLAPLASIPGRSDSLDVDVKLTPLGDTPPAAPTLAERRELKSAAEAQAVEDEMSGKAVEGTGPKQLRADAAKKPEGAASSGAAPASTA